jgi:Linear amide C-N hydrolases, choloylglycine hydrolase family
LLIEKGFGGNNPLPGTNKSEDRFVRASYYQKNLPKPNSVHEAVADVISMLGMSHSHLVLQILIIHIFQQQDGEQSVTLLTAYTIMNQLLVLL